MDLFEEPENYILRADLPGVKASDVDIQGAADSGSTIDISWGVENAGTRDTRTDYWIDRVYISMDASLDEFDLMIGEVKHNAAVDKTGVRLMTVEASRRPI